MNPSKPLRVLHAEGGYRGDRHANRGPKTGGQPLRKPAGLGNVASAHWDFVIRTRRAWLASSDAPALKRLCSLWSLSEEARKLAEKKPTDKDARCSFNAYHAEWSKLAARFGLTPSDRARLGEDVEDRQQNAEIEEMLR